MSSRQERWLLLALFVIMAILQIALTRRQGLWADEIFSLAIATGHSLEHPAAAAQPQLGDFVEPSHAVPANEFRRYLKHDNPPASPARIIRAVLLSDTSPPLYYLLLYGWTLVLGTSDVALRLFSVACSLGCLPLLASVARRTGGKRAVLPSCILFAFSPLGIYYSTEGRMYSLLILLTLATARVSLALQERELRVGLCALWIGLSAAGFLTHYFFLFPWLAMVGFLVVQPGKSNRYWLLLCIFLTGAAILPWYLVVPDAFGRWRVTQDWLKWRPAGFQRWHALSTQFSQFFSATGAGLWTTPRYAAAVALSLFTTVAVGMVWRLGWHVLSGRRLLLWLWFMAACVAPFAVDGLQHTYISNVPRYAFAALPAAYLLAAIGLRCLSRPIRLTLLTLVVMTWTVPLLNVYRQHSRKLEPFREVAYAVSSGGNGSDSILVHSIPSGVLGIARYANGSAMIASWVGQLGTRRVPDSLPALIGGSTQVWLTKLHEVGQPAPEEEWLRSNGEVLTEKRIGAAKIIRFAPKNAATF
jgi:uncharacterized membrane protein